MLRASTSSGLPAMLVWALRYLAVTVVSAGVFAVWHGLPERAPGPDGTARAAVRPDREAVFETVIEPGPGGHFWVQATLDGEPIELVIDTGATDITLSLADARRLGFEKGRLQFDRAYQSANGVILGAPVRIRELRIGQQSLYDVDAVVVDAPLEVSLLGMSFLRRLDSYGVERGRLVLRW